MKTRTAPYQTEQAKLQTAPRYLVRFFTSDGLAFSRDFADGVIQAATKTPYPYLVSISGNSQTIDHRTFASTFGNFQLALLDKGGLLTTYMSDPRKGLKSAISATEVTALNADATVGGYPDQGTLDLVTATGIKERIRYTSLDEPGQRFLGITRGVDGTSAQAWPAGTVLSNGEQIRPRARVRIMAGYDGIAESDFMTIGTYEVIERALQADRVTWLVTASDIQRAAVTRVFLSASSLAKVALGPEHPLLIALRVLLSTGLGTQGAYDTLSEDNGVGIPPEWIDIAGWEALQATVFPSAVFAFSITGPEDALTWIQAQCLTPLGIVPWITQSGKLSVRQLALSAVAADAVIALTPSNIMRFAWQAGDRLLSNALDVAYDFDVDATLPGDYARREQYRAAKSDKTGSIDKYGKQGAIALTLTGARSTHGVRPLFDALAARLFRRYGEPNPQLQVDLQYRAGHHLEPGDIVTVTHPDVPNLISGVRGLAGELMQVLDTRPVFGPTGRMVCTLGTVARQPAPGGDVFARTSFGLVVLPALTAPESFTAAQLDANVVLTWKSVAGAAGSDAGTIGYEIRDGASWDAGIIVTPDWAGASYIVPNVLDGVHTYRLKAFRKDATGVKTYGPEATVAIATANNDVARNLVIDRDEVALGFPGTKVQCAYLSELPALADLNGAWFDTLPTRWFDGAAITALWFRLVGARVYTTPVIDQGKIGPAAVLATLGVSALDSTAWFDSYGDRWYTTYPSDWFSLLTGAATITIEIALSDDNLVWGNWQPYQQGANYAFRYLKLRVTVTSQSDTAWIKYTVFRLTIDVEDVIQRVRDYAVPAAVTTVAYASLTPPATYVVAPFVIPILKGGLVNKSIIIANITATAFDLSVRDKTDALIAGTVDLDIHGY